MSPKRKLITIAVAAALAAIALFASMAGIAPSSSLAAAPAPTYTDVSYGPLKRDVFDFWKADSKTPTPLVIYIHGGGFISGDKDLVNKKDIDRFLAAGISVASIRYPFYKEVPMLEIIRDHIARAVQFMRYKSAEYNIDKTRIAVYGHSAGAGSSLWLAAHDDIADPASPDPVLRESSRVTAAAPLSTQATYDLPAWEPLFAGQVATGTIKTYHLAMAQTVLDMYHLKNEKQLNKPEALAMRHELDMLALLDKSDPPIYLETHQGALRDGDLLHHELHPKAVKKTCDERGLDCTLVLDSTPPSKYKDVVDFLISKLK